MLVETAALAYILTSGVKLKELCLRQYREERDERKGDN
jgi:hypothetical protein